MRGDAKRPKECGQRGTFPGFISGFVHLDVIWSGLLLLRCAGECGTEPSGSLTVIPGLSVGGTFPPIDSCAVAAAPCD